MLPQQVIAEALIEGRKIVVALAPQDVRETDLTAITFRAKLDLLKSMPDGRLARIRFHGCDGYLVTSISMSGHNLLQGPPTEPALIEKVELSEPWRKLNDVEVRLTHRRALQ